MSRMKKLAVALIVSCAIGCSGPERDDSGRIVANESKEGMYTAVLSIGGPEVRARYVVIDGHEYVVMTVGNGGGITHSPKCGCRKGWKAGSGR